jgi:shikimate kinase
VSERSERTPSSAVVLVGLMGSGKTTVGRIVADRLGWPLVDTDATIEASTGQTVRDIWLFDGEAAFRAHETKVLLDALAAGRPGVVAAAGGVVLADENRRALTASGATVVWLDADPAVLVGRAATGDHRPLLDADPGEALRAMAVARADLYREVAAHVIDVTDRAPDDVADEVVALLGVRRG